MTAYTLFGGGGTPALLDGSTPGYVMGIQFAVASSCTLDAVWFYSNAGAGSLPGVAVVWDASQSVAASTSSPSWSGAAGSGWVRCPLSASLAAGTYMAGAIGQNDGQKWYSLTFSDPGAVTSGPLSCPDQPCFYDGTGDGALYYPTTAWGAANDWVDVEVSASAPALPSGPLLSAGII